MMLPVLSMPALSFTISETMHNETVGEDKVSSAIDYDKHFQPEATPHNYRTDCNEAGGKKVRRILTNYFDP